MFAEQTLSSRRAALLSSALTGDGKASASAELRRRVQSGQENDTAAVLAQRTAALERIRSMMTMELDRMGSVQEIMGTPC